MKHYEYEINLFVEDELPENKKAELFGHLSKCKKCSSLLTDFSSIKSDLANFYKVLPQNVNVMNNKFSERRKINWSVKKAAFKISFSIALGVVAIFFFLLSLNLHQDRNNSNTLAPLENTNAGKSDNILFSDFVQYAMINQVNNHEEIIEFNEFIDKSLISKEHDSIAIEILNIHADNGLKNFNEIINKSLENYFRD